MPTQVFLRVLFMGDVEFLLYDSRNSKTHLITCRSIIAALKAACFAHRDSMCKNLSIQKVQKRPETKHELIFGKIVPKKDHVVNQCSLAWLKVLSSNFSSRK